ncbi:potassium uptake TrkH family protein [Streptosporangium becharense]|uniref:Potassium uptake TrkH family protein n=1 Tax=Streptosporangium becharense TaxID=1816182 RepID=A0A7W9MEU5_9ACTN|nr:potassium transporter TrkG [Streptosporangium becharense]MBB2912838.1 potassium uptake TrkH family protein [Streptosporangium becharense]MBB5818337.1 potassium uptake TrkH family protein [Streptosporangium becharense]
MKNLLGQINTPSRVVVFAFMAVVLIGTGLLSLPIAIEGERASLTSALFTATSAVCVTGLAVHDTASHWSVFGELVILVLMQVGGFGIMTLSSILALIVSGKLGLRARLNTQAETKTLGPGDVRQVITGVAKVALVAETLTAAVLTVRFVTGYGEPVGRALYYGVFHAVSAFTNAGFALWPDGLMRFVTDPWICLPLALAVVAGGLGFPVYAVLRENWRRPKRWSLHTKITLGMTAILLAGGTLAITGIEWNNPGTLGPLSPGLRIMAGFFHTTMTRSGGLNSVDISQMNENSWLVSDMLMFIGAGSASTGGGIKVTTFALLGFVIMAELRGEPDVSAGRRRIPEHLQRQALTIALLSVAFIALGTFVMMMVTPFKLDRVLFEVISAFATVGLSTGITADVGTAGHLVLTALMFVGRLGPVTLGAALALHAQTRRFRYPEERPLVG